MEGFWDIAIPLAALLGVIVLAAVLLARARNNAKPDLPEGAIPIPASASKRQRRILSTLEPDPEIPTLMDLVREEVADLGLEDIPGATGLSRPVMLKAFRRDALADCSHDTREFVVTDGVDPANALEADVELVCSECAEEGTKPED
ncbi:MAG: hypothetical protein GY722_25315 [bacterium]|nr:hypothetical protein [bacterium]